MKIVTTKVRSSIIFFLLLSLLTPSLAHAIQPDPIAINNISLLDATVVSQQLNNGKLALSIIATVEGTVDCQSNQSCHNAGADGKVIAFQLDLQSVVDAARERTTGQIVIDVIDAGFSGEANGSATSLPGNILQLDLTTKANSLGGAKANFVLTVVYNQATGLLESLTGQGIVSMDSIDQI